MATTYMSTYQVRKHGSLMVATRKEALAIVEAAADQGYTFWTRPAGLAEHVVVDGDL